MTETTQVSVRVRAADLDRAGELVQPIQDSALGAAMRVTRAAVLRLALVRGLEQLEKEHASKRD